MKKLGILYLDGKLTLCKGIVEINDISNRIILLNNEKKVVGTAVSSVRGDRTVLNYIYCYQEHRRNGVGRTLTNIVETFALAKDSTAVIGMFCPLEEPTDIVKFGHTDYNTLKINTKRFYNRAGYSIIELKDYCKSYDKKEFEGIKRRDFIFDSIDYDIIIYKSLKRVNPKFELVADTLMDTRLFENDINFSHKI